MTAATTTTIMHISEESNQIKLLRTSSSFTTTSCSAEDNIIHAMISKLTDREMEIAAQTSYEYFKYNKGNRKDIVSRMAQRYLDSKKDPDVALTKMRETLAFRQTVNIDAIRTAFDEKNECNNNSSADLKALLEHRLSKKSHYVQGYDRDGRATYLFTPRLVDEHEEEGSTKEILYSIERALACSSTINVIIDFSSFSLTKNTPPPSIGKKTLLILRNHYVGQINKIFILDAPATFSILWKMFSGFVGKETKKKIVFVNKKKKATIMSRYYSDQEATSWMIPDRGQKNRQLDVNEYFYKLPFDQAFDETPST